MGGLGNSGFYRTENEQEPSAAPLELVGDSLAIRVFSRSSSLRGGRKWFPEERHTPWSGLSRGAQPTESIQQDGVGPMGCS